MELLTLLISSVAGALLGLIFFWGLWLTVSRLATVRYPAFLMLGSLTLRLMIVLSGLFLIARYAGWEHVIAAVIGFTIARLFMVRRMKPKSAHLSMGSQS